MTAAINTFAALSAGVDAPATRAYVPTKHDTNELTYVSRGLYVGGAGDVKVTMADDVIADAVVFSSVPAGTLLPYRVKQIFSTGTTATNLVVVY